MGAKIFDVMGMSPAFINIATTIVSGMAACLHLLAMAVCPALKPLPNKKCLI